MRPDAINGAINDPVNAAINFLKKNFFFIILSVWWLALQWTYSGQWPKPADDWKEVVLYSGAACLFLWGKIPTLKKTFLNYILLTYVAVTLLSLKSGIAWYDGVIEIARLVIWVALGYVFSTLSGAHLRTFFRLSTISAALIALITLMESYGFTFWARFPVYITNTLNPIGHVSYYGLFMATSLVISVWLYMTDQRISWRTVDLLASTLIFKALWYTGTRSNLVGLLLGVILSVVLVMKYKKFSQKNLLNVSVLVLVMMVTTFAIKVSYYRAPTLERFTQVTEALTHPTAQSLETASSQRFVILEKTLKLILEKPLLGWGVDGFRFVYPGYAKGYSYSINSWLIHPHNEIAHQWATLGIVGLIVFCLFWWCIYRHAFLKLQTSAHFSQLLMALAGIAVTLGSWLFDTNYQLPVSRAFLALFVGIIVREISFSNSEKSEFFPKSGIALQGFVILSSFILSSYFAALYYVKLSETWERRGDMSEAYHTADVAYRLCPRQFDVNFRYGTIHFRNQNPAESPQSIRNLVSDYPYTPMALMLAADLSYAQGDFFNAREYAYQALKSDPNLDRALALIKSLKHP